MFGSFANTFSLWQSAYNLFVLSTGLLIPAKVSCVHEEGYKTPFMKYNFFSSSDHQISSSSGCLCYYILFYFVTLQLLRKSAVKINSFCQKKEFQELKLGQRCQVKVWVRTWLAVVTKKTDLTKWCKKCIPVHWCHLHSWCRVVIVKPLKRVARRTHNRHPILFPRRGSRGSFMRENWTTRILFFIASKVSS